jgi:predicted ABC-type ATPase
MYFVWLPSPELALLRIEDRVRHGGHDVPSRDVRRRFDRSIHNLFREYLCLMDSVFVFDNSGVDPQPIWIMQAGVRACLDPEKAAQFVKEGEP